VPSLAGPRFLRFQTPPPDWLAEVGHLSASCASFLWNGLSHDTRRVYSSARTSYEDFCANSMVASPWPANENVLAEWISLRARGSITERALKPDTLQSYLSALRSVHVLGSSAVKLTLYSRESTSYLLPLGPLRAQYTPFANSSNWTHVQTTHLSSTLHTANLLITPSSQFSKSESVAPVSLTQLRTKAIASAEAPPSRPPITVSLTQISKLLDVGPPKPLRLTLKPSTRSATTSALGF
jgi:hypothetical protein